jgi:uncharacterized membrane protein
MKEMRVIGVSRSWLRVSGMHARHWSGKHGGRQMIRVFRSPREEFDKLLLFSIDCFVCVCVYQAVFKKIIPDISRVGLI